MSRTGSSQPTMSCPRCSYDLTPLYEALGTRTKFPILCPECGADDSTEMRLDGPRLLGVEGLLATSWRLFCLWCLALQPKGLAERLGLLSRIRRSEIAVIAGSWMIIGSLLFGFTLAILLAIDTFYSLGFLARPGFSARSLVSFIVPRGLFVRHWFVSGIVALGIAAATAATVLMPMVLSASSAFHHARKASTPNPNRPAALAAMLSLAPSTIVLPIYYALLVLASAHGDLWAVAMTAVIANVTVLGMSIWTAFYLETAVKGFISVRSGQDRSAPVKLDIFQVVFIIVIAYALVIPVVPLTIHVAGFVHDLLF